MSRPDPLDDLRSATCSNGAPSARNLLVTVFGDSLLPHGVETEISVRSLAALLRGFGVSERLVRTSLTRLVNDEVLDVRSEGRRSYYRVADGARTTFRRGDERIYRTRPLDWDGAWTMIVIDGAEGTPSERATLRQELSAAGLGVIAPNVLAAPAVEPEVVAEVIGRFAGTASALVTRSGVVEAPGALTSRQLARRCAPIDELADAYSAFAHRFRRFERLTRLDPPDAFKLRTLVVASFRRLVLADPLLPGELLPVDWVGVEARRIAARLYESVAVRGEQHLVDLVEPKLERAIDPVGRFLS